jgi:hypothetical protein
VHDAVDVQVPTLDRAGDRDNPPTTVTRVDPESHLIMESAAAGRGQ